MKFDLTRIADTLKRHFWVSIMLVVIAFIAIFFIVFLFKGPEFPETVPSYEQVKEDVTKERAQFEFFTRLTKYLRDNHGGIVYTDERAEYEELYLDRKPLIKTYIQRFNSIDKQKILALATSFSKTEGVEVSFQEPCAYPEEGLDCLQLEFYKNATPWVNIQLEYPELEDSGGISDIIGSDNNTVPQDQQRMRETGNPILAIIIDDCGYRMDVFYDLVSLGYQLTYSILPQLPYSEESASVAKQAGQEIMLHLPMQPKDWPEFDPGLGALMVHDSPETLVMKLTINLQTVPNVLGVNNHMGSAFTTYTEGLDVVMRFLGERSLFFLDSKTAPGNTARTSAKKFGVPYLSRDVFLDNTRSVEATAKQLYKAARLAERTGRAIAIGHLYPSTYQALAETLSDIESKGVDIVPISAFVKYSEARRVR